MEYTSYVHSVCLVFFLIDDDDYASVLQTSAQRYHQNQLLSRVADQAVSFKTLSLQCSVFHYHAFIKNVRHDQMDTMGPSETSSGIFCPLQPHLESIRTAPVFLISKYDTSFSASF